MRKHRLISENEKINGIRVRGIEVSRVEGLTDAVFGLAVTLLIVSEEVPKTIDELFAMVLGFPSFALTFMLMLVIWNWHYRYFRKYGLNTERVMKANGLLLFLVLLFMFPLKFLASFVVDFVVLEQWFGFDMPTNYQMSANKYDLLHILYACGFASVFWCFAWLYKIAYDARDLIGLSEVEALRTQNHMRTFIVVAAVPLATIPLLYLPTPFAPMIAGFSNCLIWPISRTYTATITRKLEASIDEETA
jgi:uncharacterized membrane protein